MKGPRIWDIFCETVAAIGQAKSWVQTWQTLPPNTHQCMIARRPSITADSDDASQTATRQAEGLMDRTLVLSVILLRQSLCNVFHKT